MNMKELTAVTGPVITYESIGLKLMALSINIGESKDIMKTIRLRICFKNLNEKIL